MNNDQKTLFQHMKDFRNEIQACFLVSFSSGPFCDSPPASKVEISGNMSSLGKPMIVFRCRVQRVPCTQRK